MNLITKTELSRMVNRSDTTIWKAVRNGKLREVGRGRKGRIDLDDAVTVQFIHECKKYDDERRSECVQPKDITQSKVPSGSSLSHTCAGNWDVHSLIFLSDKTSIEIFHPLPIPIEIIFFQGKVARDQDGFVYDVVVSGTRGKFNYARPELNLEKLPFQELPESSPRPTLIENQWDEPSGDTDFVKIGRTFYPLATIRCISKNIDIYTYWPLPEAVILTWPSDEELPPFAATASGKRLGLYRK